MTGEALKAALMELYGPRGWQRRAAEGLGINVCSVRRYVKGERRVPKVVALAVGALQGAN